jgi:hypothetical protein
MDLERIVQIIVEKQGAVPSISTGYLIAPGRVLTAQHALVDPKSIGRGKVRFKGDRLEFRLVASGECAEISIARAFVARSFLPALLLEATRVEIDIAILDAGKLGAELGTTLPRLDPGVPKDGAAWISRGFPRGRPDKRGHVERKAKPATGLAFRSVGSPAPSITLHVTTPPKDWGGMSGAPVFVDGSIVGVVQAIDPDYGTSSLEATLLSSVWDDARFQKAAGIENPAEDYELLATHLEKLEVRATRRPDWVRRFSADWAKALRGKSKSYSSLARSLGAALDRESGEQIVGACVEALLPEDGGASRPEWEFFSRVLGVLLPWCREFRDARRVASHRGRKRVRLSVVSSAIIELVDAYVQSRRPDWRVSVDGERPMGTACVGEFDEGLEKGRHSKTLPRADCWMRELASRVDIDASNIDSPSRRKKLIARVRIRLCNRRARNYRPPYLIERRGPDSDSEAFDKDVSKFLESLDGLVRVYSTTNEPSTLCDTVEAWLMEAIDGIEGAENS